MRSVYSREGMNAVMLVCSIIMDQFAFIMICREFGLASRRLMMDPLTPFDWRVICMPAYFMC